MCASNSACATLSALVSHRSQCPEWACLASLRGIRCRFLAVGPSCWGCTRCDTRGRAFRVPDSARGRVTRKRRWVGRGRHPAVTMSGKYSDDEYEYESGGSGFDDDDDDGGYTYESDDDADDGDFEMKMPHRSGDSYTVYNLDEIAARQEQARITITLVWRSWPPATGPWHWPQLSLPPHVSQSSRTLPAPCLCRSPPNCRTCLHSRRHNAAPYCATTSGTPRP